MRMEIRSSNSLLNKKHTEEEERTEKDKDEQVEENRTLSLHHLYTASPQTGNSRGDASERLAAEDKPLKTSSPSFLPY